VCDLFWRSEGKDGTKETLDDADGKG